MTLEQTLGYCFSISESQRPPNKRRKRKGSNSAGAGAGANPIAPPSKKRSPGPNFALASQASSSTNMLCYFHAIIGIVFEPQASSGDHYVYLGGTGVWCLNKSLLMHVQNISLTRSFLWNFARTSLYLQVVYYLIMITEPNNELLDKPGLTYTSYQLNPVKQKQKKCIFAKKIYLIRFFLFFVILEWVVLPIYLQIC